MSKIIKKCGEQYLPVIILLLFSIWIATSIEVKAEAAKGYSDIEITAEVGSRIAVAEDSELYLTILANYDSTSTFHIGTKEELAAIAKMANEGQKTFEGKTIVLTADIDLEGAGIVASSSITDEIAGMDTNKLTISGTAQNVWTPIGKDKRTPFKGTFDGAGYEIDNMIVLEKYEDKLVYAGLFGYAADCEIKNLGISTRSYVIVSSLYAISGGIAGHLNNGDVSNSHNAGNVISSASSQYAAAGGIVGACSMNSSIRSCYNIGKVSGMSISSNAYVGGIVGQGTKSSINGSYHSGEVSSMSSYITYAGGIGGYTMESSISSSYNNGEVTGLSSTASSASLYAGGIVAYCSLSTISNTYHTGKVYSASWTSDVGGIAGRILSSSIDNSYNTGEVCDISIKASHGGGISGTVSTGSVSSSISNSYNIGEVRSQSTTSSSSSGGIIGIGYAGTEISNCYNLGNVSCESPDPGLQMCGGIIGLNARNSAEIKDCYYDKEIILSGHKITDEGTEQQGLAEAMAVSNYKTDGNHTIFDADADSVWYFAAANGDRGIHPELRLLYQKQNLTISKNETTLTASFGETAFLKNVDPEGITYQWYADGVAIANADSFQYTLTDNELGKVVYVAARAGNYETDIYSNAIYYIYYKVSFVDESGKSVDMPTEQMVLYGETADEPSVDPTRAGYEFDGWYSDETYNEKWNFTTNTLTKDIWLYAKWKINVYHVEVDENIENGAITIDKGTGSIGDMITVTVAANPGYRFVEGSLQLTGDESAITPTENAGEYRFTMPAGNVIVTARFEAVYTVTYDGNGAERGDAPQDETEYGYGQEVVLLDNVSLERTDYEFKGWSLQPDGSGIRYNPGQTFTITGAVVLYAIWEQDGGVEPVDPYRITYDGNNNTGGTALLDENEYVHGDFATVGEQGSLVRVGYTFVGWSTSAEGASIILKPGDQFVITGDVTLYAVWERVEEITYTVTYDPNGGEQGTVPVDENKYQESEEALVQENNTLIKEGYTFIGWNTDKEAEVAAYTAGDLITMNRNITLYAIWQANPKPTGYHVTYHGNGNSGGTVPSDTKEYLLNERANVLAHGDLIREGYKFQSWNTHADGSGQNYQANEQLEMTADVDLYAVWEKAIPGDQPQQPQKPQPDVPEGGGSNQSKSNPATAGVKTGDEADLVLWVMLMAVAFVFISRTKKGLSH